MGYFRQSTWGAIKAQSSKFRLTIWIESMTIILLFGEGKCWYLSKEKWFIRYCWVFLSCCCGQAADKGQPSIAVSHLWVSVSGSITLLISTMLAWLQQTEAHQLAWELAHSLCRPSIARHKEEWCQERRDEHKYPPTPWNKHTNKASPVDYEYESLSVLVCSRLRLSLSSIHGPWHQHRGWRVNSGGQLIQHLNMQEIYMDP